MKGGLTVGALALCIFAHSATASAVRNAGASFGPQNCVTLSRSPEGTCVLSTDCEGADTSQTEFAFDCIGKKSIVRHSFGVGGFEANEDFDTDVKCDQCNVATPEETAPARTAKLMKVKPSEIKAYTASLAASAKEDPPKEAKESEKAKEETKESKDAAKSKEADEAKKSEEKPKESKESKEAAKSTDGDESKESKKEKKEEKAKESKEQGKSKEDEQEKAKESKKSKESKESKKSKEVKKQKEAKKEATAKGSWLPFWSAKKEEPADAVKYGPNECVSTYKSKAGTCIMSTDCKSSDISNYEFGLVCVDKVGSPVKHLFGKDSFDPQETFDTLIKCKQCLGLENIPDAVTLAGEVATMAKEIKSMNAAMKNISINVNMLNEKVFPTADAAAPAPAAAAAASPVAAAAEKPKAKAKGKAKLLSHHSHLKKHHLRRKHHRRHHHRREYDDDDDYDGEYYDGDQESYD